MVASPFWAVAQRGPGLQGAQLGTRDGQLSSATQQNARLQHSPCASKILASTSLETGSLTSRTRNGRNGWWWDVGSVWYFCPEQIEGPPDRVSDIKVVDHAIIEVADDTWLSHNYFAFSFKGDCKNSSLLRSDGGQGPITRAIACAVIRTPRGRYVRVDRRAG